VPGSFAIFRSFRLGPAVVEGRWPKETKEAKKGDLERSGIGRPGVRLFRLFSLFSAKSGVGGKEWPKETKGAEKRDPD
jgi:hypothetical protein